MKQKEIYEKPSVFVIPNLVGNGSFLSISGSLSDYDENDEEWGDGGGNAKEAFFGLEYGEGDWFNDDEQ